MVVPAKAGTPVSAIVALANAKIRLIQETESKDLSRQAF
jgi:hypothetical protein